MPATITHAYFSKDVYDILPTDIRTSLDLDRFKMFGQSMDSLRFFSLFHLGKKQYASLGSLFHRSKSQEYFINLIQYIKQNHLIDNKDVLSYLSGLICHYVLDSNIHPYVFYKTGYFNRNDSKTYKYNNIHLFMETFIDNDMVKRRERINPYKFNIAHFCFDTKKFSTSLTHAIDYSFSKTFHIDHMGSIYYQSLKDMRLALRLFRQDRFGVKKFFYKLIDTFTPKYIFRFEAISYHYPLIDKHHFLNNSHDIWHHPVDYSITSQESFIDLYLKSIKEAKKIIIDTFSYMQGKDIVLENLFTNKSYVTGLNCDLDKELKYFEF